MKQKYFFLKAFPPLTVTFLVLMQVPFRQEKEEEEYNKWLASNQVRDSILQCIQYLAFQEKVVVSRQIRISLKETIASKGSSLRNRLIGICGISRFFQQFVLKWAVRISSFLMVI